MSNENQVKVRNSEYNGPRPPMPMVPWSYPVSLICKRCKVELATLGFESLWDMRTMTEREEVWALFPHQPMSKRWHPGKATTLRCVACRRNTQSLRAATLGARVMEARLQIPTIEV